METIYIACACDNAYSPHCGTMLASVFEHNFACHIEVWLLTDYIDTENIQRFYTLAARYNQRIQIVTIDKSQFQNLPFGGEFENITLAAYYRLLIPYVLPRQINKILYLDSDIVVLGDLTELWHTPLSHRAFAAVEDALPHPLEAPIRLNYPITDSYYNTGVSLFNLTFLREMDFVNQAKVFCECYKDKILMHDQDIMNALCHGKYQALPLRYNVMESLLFRKPPLSSSRIPELESALRNPCVMHYTGIFKPWFNECHHPYKHLYWKYRSLTPWSDGKPLRKYCGWKHLLAHLKYFVKQYLLPVVGIEHHTFIGCKKFFNA